MGSGEHMGCRDGTLVGLVQDKRPVHFTVALAKDFISTDSCEGRFDSPSRWGGWLVMDFLGPPRPQ